MAKSRKDQNRAIRQESLREYLSNQEHLRGVSQLIEKIEVSSDSFEVTKYKTAAELKLKLVNKYLPDLKSTELTGDGGGDIRATIAAFEINGVIPSDESE